MTRIGHFNLYECPKCGQIHIKSEYSSISLYMGMPPDAYYAPTDLMICQKCGEKSPFSEYIPVGQMEPREFKEKWMDPRSLFPYFSDQPHSTSLRDPMEILSRIGDESFCQFGRKIPKSWISTLMDKCRKCLRLF